MIIAIVLRVRNNILFVSFGLCTFGRPTTFTGCPPARAKESVPPARAAFRVCRVSSLPGCRRRRRAIVSRVTHVPVKRPSAADLVPDLKRVKRQRIFSLDPFFPVRFFVWRSVHYDDDCSPGANSPCENVSGIPRVPSSRTVVCPTPRDPWTGQTAG